MTESEKRAREVETHAFREAFLEVIDAVRGLTRAQVTVHDISGFLRQSGALQVGDREIAHHDCAFCRLVRDLPGGRAGCVTSDLEEGYNRALEAGRPVWRRCHAGMWELATPVFFEGRLVALVFLGQARVRGKGDSPDLDALRLLGAADGPFLEGYRALPPADAKAMERGALLLQRALQEILCVMQGPSVRAHLLQEEYSLSNRALRLLRTQIEQGTDVETLAEKLHVSAASLTRAFRREMGISLKQYIDGARFSLACRLLREGRQRVATVGMNVGFRDQSTFLHWFSRRAGCTPLQYRGAQAGQAECRLDGRGARADYVPRVQAYLRESYRKEVRVSVLAARLGVTPDHLNRLFRRETGETITQALWRMRLQSAKEELQHSGAPVGQIAWQNGFPKQSAFASRFHQAFGMTPGEFRREACQTSHEEP